MDTRERLVRLLADGELHSGNVLAGQLGLTRAGVWKALQGLTALGLSIESQQGKGYRLSAPLELLDKDRISAELELAGRSALERIDVHWSLPSTSDWLLEQPPAERGHARACLTELQLRGRGRRGRTWVAPLGDSLCLSLGWSFLPGPPDLSCLGLAAGIGVWRALRTVGADIQLKWPNDIVLAGRKLAGILVDVRGEAGGPLLVVVGVGINVRLDGAAAARVVAAGGVTPASLCESEVTAALSRNLIAARVLNNLCQVLAEFSQHGFAALAVEWTAADYLVGREVTVHEGDKVSVGIAGGVGLDGQLLLDTGRGVRRLHSGDVSVRLQQ